MRSKSTSPPEMRKPRFLAPASSRSQPLMPSSGMILNRAVKASGLRWASRRMRWQARVSTSMMASRTAPVKARCRPIVSSSNLGHRIPGVSSSSRPWSTVIHCLPRVTPGRSPALADFFLATLLMKVDLPTLGMPTTMARTGRPTWPFSFHRAICSFSAPRMTGENCFTPAPLRASHSSTEMPLLRK